MKKISIALFIFASMNTLPALAQDNTQIELTQQQQTAYHQLQTKSSSFSVSWNDLDTIPQWLRMENLDIDWLSEDYTERAYQFLGEYGSLYKIEDPNQELHLKKVKRDKLGMTHVTLQQNYQGVPFYAGQLQFHFRTNGSISSINGNIIPHYSTIIAEPTITPHQAKQIAENAIRNRFDSTEEQFNKLQLQSTKPELYFYNHGIFSKHKEDTYLVWTFSVYSEKILMNQLFYINANDGSVVNVIDNIQTSKDIDTYVLADCTDEVGTLTYDETSSDESDTVNSASTDIQAWQVNDYTGLVYDYFDDTFGRDSYNDTDPDDSTDGGAMIQSYTHYEVDENNDGTCEQFENAGWDPTGRKMGYGEDYITLDVTGHELSHAVIQYAVGTTDDDTLTYENETGALNESYADVFGEFVEFENGGGDWLHREDYKDGANRSLEDPALYGQPDHTNDQCSEINDYCGYVEDNGGIHTNSGIHNKAAYLLTEGGEHHSIIVNGIGREAVENIYYRVLTADYLNIASDFMDAYQATLQSCLDFYETDPTIYPSSYCESIFDAYTAVGINTESSYLTASATASTTSGYAPLTVDFDGSDSISIGGTITDYEWDLDSSRDSDGDGDTLNDIDNTGPVASYTYNIVGRVNTWLTVKDSTGNTSEDFITIVTENPIEPSFTIAGDRKIAPATVSFDASATIDHTGTVTDYSWDFGDGSTAHGVIVNHTFTNPGTYNVILTVTDSNGYSATIRSAATLYVGSSISTTSWTKDRSPYIIYGSSYGDATIASGSILTIDPGVVVKFYSTNRKLIVSGTLNASGTATEQIVFTSYKDDTFGGDSNGDGSATTSTAGDWRQISFGPSSSGTMDYVYVRYGGYDTSGTTYPMMNSAATNLSVSHSTFADSKYHTIVISAGAATIDTTHVSDNRGLDAINISNSTVLLTNNTITSALGAGIRVYNASPTITNNTITGANYGINTSGNTSAPLISGNSITNYGGAGLMVGSGTPIISGNIIEDTDDTALYLLGGSPMVSNNRFGGTLGYALYLSNGTPVINNNTVFDSNYGLYLAGGSAKVTYNTVTGTTYPIVIGTFNEAITISGNTGTGNTYNSIVLNGPTHGNITLNMDNDFIYTFGNNFNVRLEDTLSVPAGTVVKFLNSSSSFTVYGALDVIGTATEPVIFTSINDDDYGGDTNNDSSTSSPAAGDWSRIFFASGSTASINNSIIRYGGGSGYTHMILIQSDTIILTESTISNSATSNISVSVSDPILTGNVISSALAYGIYISSSSPIIDSNIIRNNYDGIYSSSSAIITNNLFDSNTYDGVFLRGMPADFSGNILSHNRYGIYITGGVSPTIMNNSIVNNSIYGIYNAVSSATVIAESNWWGDASGPYHATNPTGTGNAVSNYVDFDPWLTADPDIDVTPPADVVLGDVSQDVWQSSITLNWTNPADTDFYHVRIERTDAAGMTVTLTENATGTTYTDTTPAYTTTYTYILYALDTSENSSAGVTTDEYNLANPVPANLMLVPGRTTITVRWTPSSAPVDSLGGYRVYYGTSPDALTTNNDVGNVTSTTLTGLSKRTQYYVAVMAYSTSGVESEQSIIKSTSTR